MSALYGLVRRDGRPVGDEELSAMDAALAPLGPDGQGRWREGPAGLGHRLMRFTPQDRLERQPLIGGGGDLVLTATGRIDGRAELCAALGVTGVEARQAPDSALILRAFEAWGVDCPARLTGSFAFAVWDRRARRLFAARSAFGGAPLLYHDGPRAFVFASRPKGLFALKDETPRRIDEAYLADYMVSMPREPGRTFYRDVRQLDPGEALIFDAGGLRQWRHWRLEDLDERRFSRPEACAEALAAVFDEAIADHLRADGHVGVMMSGGLDSTAVAGVAAAQLQASGGVLPTFTDVPTAGWYGSDPGANRYSDEGPFARAMAEHHPNLQLNLIRSEAFYFDDIVPFFEAAEHPFRNASNRAWWEGCQKAAAGQGARVLLTGLGGNMTISCDGADLLAQRLRAGDILGALGAAQEQVKAGYRRSVVRTLAGAALAAMPRGVRGLNTRLRAGWPIPAGPHPWELYSPISRQLARAVDLPGRAREKRRTFEHTSDRPIRERRLDSLRQVEGPGMDIAMGHKQLYGVDMRHPTLDRRVAEFCLSLPEAAFVPGGEPRGLLRRAMAGKVPEMILNNRKRGLQGSGWLTRLHRNRATIEEEIGRLERSPLAAYAMDIPRLRRLAETLPPEGSSTGDVKLSYRIVFEGGLMTGRFLRWFEDGK